MPGVAPGQASYKNILGEVRSLTLWRTKSIEKHFVPRRIRSDVYHLATTNPGHTCKKTSIILGLTNLCKCLKATFWETGLPSSHGRAGCWVLSPWTGFHHGKQSTNQASLKWYNIPQRPNPAISHLQPSWNLGGTLASIFLLTIYNPVEKKGAKHSPSILCKSQEHNVQQALKL